MADEPVTLPSGMKISRAPESVEMPQLRPTPKGTLEPRTVGRPILADMTLGVNLCVDMDAVAETMIFGLKIFPHREKTESYHLAEVYLLGGPAGGSFGYLGSMGLFRLDYPSGNYDVKHDDEVVETVRALLFPGPKAYK